MRSLLALIRNAIGSHQYSPRFIVWIGIFFFIFIFFGYPFFIKFLFRFLEGKESGDFNRGTFGDMYGALNTFVSSVAFLVALYAIFIQINQFKIDKEIAQNDKEELNNNLIAYFKYNLEKLNSENIIPLQIRLNKIITEKFKLREVFIDAKLSHSTDYYFRALLSISQTDIFKAYHSNKHPHADMVIELYFRIELLNNSYTQLSNLITISRQELKKMESQAYSLKTEILLRDKYSGNIFKFLETSDLFTDETLDLLVKQDHWHSTDSQLTSLIDLLETYFWKKNEWESQVIALHKELLDFIELSRKF